MADYDSGFGGGCGLVFLDYLAGASGGVKGLVWVLLLK
jgi:hypothetical protein